MDHIKNTSQKTSVVGTGAISSFTSLASYTSGLSFHTLTHNPLSLTATKSSKLH